MHPVPAVLLVTLNLLASAQAQVLEVKSRAKPKQNYQMIGANRLTSLVRERLVSELPVGMRLQELRIAEDVSLPQGELTMQVSVPKYITQGQHDLEVVLQSHTTQVSIMARVRLARSVAGRTTTILSRGSDVMVVVKSGNVTVQSQGVAQEGGAIGERIGVLPAGASRVIKGMVVDARTVEVGL